MYVLTSRHSAGCQYYRYVLPIGVLYDTNRSVFHSVYLSTDLFGYIIFLITRC